jgi:hypothetical protein
MVCSFDTINTGDTCDTGDTCGATLRDQMISIFANYQISPFLYRRRDPTNRSPAHRSIR